MNSLTLISEEQRDALQELMNISMGQAASALATLIDIRVILSIPKISVTSPTSFFEIYNSENENFYARQSFTGQFRGEVISIISKEGCEQLGETMLYEQPMSDNSFTELVLELTNILAGACLKGLVEQLDTRLHLSAPSIISAESQSVEKYSWQHALLLEICFSLEDSSFYSRLIICLDEQSIVSLKSKINELLS